jgi:hypothetical protein
VATKAKPHGDSRIQVSSTATPDRRQGNCGGKNPERDPDQHKPQPRPWKRVSKGRLATFNGRHEAEPEKQLKGRTCEFARPVKRMPSLRLPLSRRRIIRVALQGVRFRGRVRLGPRAPQIASTRRYGRAVVAFERTVVHRRVCGPAAAAADAPALRGRATTRETAPSRP